MLQNFKESVIDEECRLSIQENNKAGQKVTESNTRSHAEEYKMKCTNAFKLIRHKE
jgi:hypothetical protein